MQDNQSLLEISHVNKIFPVHKRALQAVCDVSLKVKRGECVGIVGESGCGKSTLAKMVVGSLSATSGSIRLGGVEYGTLKRKEKKQFRRKIQMVFQEPMSSFSPRMKIGSYLAEPRRNFDHISKKRALKEAEELLELVGLPASFTHRYPHELSGGQLQRAAIARAIAIGPDLLVCDEATGALDVSIQNQIARLLIDLTERRNLSCLFIGHDLALVRSVSQRIAVMYLGKIVEILESETLMEDAVHPYTKALLSAVFDVYCDQKEEVVLLKGEPPSPLQIYEGCTFAGRCPQCTEKCRISVPELSHVGGEHWAACHYHK